MPAPIRFSVAALKSAAGPAVFARGEAYHREGRVALMAVEPHEVRARVSGTQVYAATLAGADAAFEGECDCPAFEDYGFCKHLVATALAVNSASPAQLDAAAQTAARIRAHLTGLSPADLVDRLMTVAEDDEDLWRQLDLETAIATADDDTILARLREAIDEATDTDGYVDWRGAGTWADGLDKVLDQIAALVEGGRAPIALAALKHFFDGAEAAYEEIDDSDGEVSGCLDRAVELHIAACAAAPPDPLILAAELFEREAGCDFDTWTGARERYAEILGPAGRAEFHRLARAAWDACRHGDETYHRSSLRSILDDIAANDGDLDARIALRVGELAGAFDYHQIARLCLEAGREAQARSLAEEGVWKYEDRPDESLTLLAADLRRRAGEREAADTLLWALFERTPSSRLWIALSEGAADRGAALDRATATITAHIAKENARWSMLPAMLVQLLVDEGRLDQAWTAAHVHRLDGGHLERLARTTQESHPEEALAAYAELVEGLIRNTANSSYAEACRHLAQMERLRARLGPEEEHAAHLADLALRHKAKRNFIRHLADPRAWEAR
jgi:uncharacterized Zn finger protein